MWLDLTLINLFIQVTNDTDDVNQENESSGTESQEDKSSKEDASLEGEEHSEEMGGEGRATVMRQIDFLRNQIDEELKILQSGNLLEYFKYYKVWIVVHYLYYSS